MLYVSYIKAKFQGLRLYGLQEILCFVPAKELFYRLLQKRNRVALAGLGPQDIPHQTAARPELAGALFRYINSVKNLQSLLN